MGDYEHPLGGRGGKLEAALAAEGVAPEDVSVLVITHAHLDHIGGLAKDGAPAVPRRPPRDLADRVGVVARPGRPGRRRSAAAARAAGVLELVDAARRARSRRAAPAAPGHTPGHLAVEIPGELLFLADAIVDPRHVEHPEWAMAFDEDREAVVRTRRRAARPRGRRRPDRHRLAPTRSRARRAHRRGVPASRLTGPSCAAGRRCAGGAGSPRMNGPPRSLRSNRSGRALRGDDRLARARGRPPARRRGGSDAGR